MFVNTDVSSQVTLSPHQCFRQETPSMPPMSKRKVSCTVLLHRAGWLYILWISYRIVWPELHLCQTLCFWMNLCENVAWKGVNGLREEIFFAHNGVGPLKPRMAAYLKMAAIQMEKLKDWWKRSRRRPRVLAFTSTRRRSGGRGYLLDCLHQPLRWPEYFSWESSPSRPWPKATWEVLCVWATTYHIQWGI